MPEQSRIPEERPHVFASPTVSEKLASSAMGALGDTPTMFGVVGNGNIHLASAFHKLGGTYVSLRHEAGAVASADAYFRATGRLAIATTTYGPGFTNALTALSETQAAGIPLVLVAGDCPTSGIRPIDVDQKALLDALGVEHWEVSPHNADHILTHAAAFARSRRVPVALTVPHDVVVAPAVGVDSDFSYATPSAPAPQCASEVLDDIAERLVRAHRPLIIVGRGVVESRTEGLAERLGDQLGALFATSALARRSVSEQWCLGVAGGFAQRGRLETFRSADMVLALGAGLNKLQARAGTLLNPKATVIRLSDKAHPATFLRAVEQVDCMLEDALPALLERVTAKKSARKAGAGDESTLVTWRDQLGELPAEEREELDPGCFATTASDGRLDPRHVLRRLDQLLPLRRSVVMDGGHFVGWVGKYLHATDPRSTVILGSAIMTIGLGYPSAVGVGVGRPEQTTVLIGGDGGTLMGLADAESFYRSVPRSVTIIMNDAAYGAEVHQYAKEGVSQGPMLLDDVDYAALASGFGVAALTVTSPAQLEDGGEVQRFLAANADGRCLLDIKISREPVADFIKEL